MAIDRRALIAGLTAMGVGVSLGSPGRANGARAAVASAYRMADGSFGAAIVNADGSEVGNVPLPGRGHDIAVCPISGTCVVLARRPGKVAVAFSCKGRDRAPIAFCTPTNRHFYGHGVFSADGRLLYTTENDFDAGIGRIGVYDVASGFSRIGDLPSYGVGPHDIAMLPRSSVLVVANGGVREHPGVGAGRQALNLDALSPSIAYIDAQTGDLLELHRLPETMSHVSLRHLDVAASGAIVIGGQVIATPLGNNDNPRREPLVLTHRRQSNLLPIDLDPSVHSALSGYISSVAVDFGGHYATVTSSRGGIALTFKIDTGRVVRTTYLSDVSGVVSTAEPGGFVLTSGHGAIVTIGADAGNTMRNASSPRPSRVWDNHAAAIPR